MAEVTKDGTPSLCTALPCRGHFNDAYRVGEDVAVGDACYYAADGTVKLSTAAAADAKVEVDGFAPIDAKSAQRDTLSLVHDVTFRYGTGLTPGTYLYLSATVPGGLSTTAPTNQPKPIARVEPDGKRIRVFRTYGGS